MLQREHPIGTVIILFTLLLGWNGLIFGSIYVRIYISS